MPHYDTAFSPPAPCLDVQVSSPGVPDHRIDLRGKLDTGADLCVMPDHVAAVLQLVPVDVVQVQGYDRQPVSRSLFLVDLQLAGIHLEDVETVASPRADILIARNVLNQFFITLDGKGLAFEIEDR